MKFLHFSILLLISQGGFSQNLQIHYDFRHTLDPTLNPNNFPSFSFEFFREIDSAGSGSFLFKMQADLKGQASNVGQVFTQVTQTLRFWKPKVYLSLNYSGGLGVSPDGYGFYLSNAFATGVSYPFQWKGAWFSTQALFRYNAFKQPSYDVQGVFYFGKGFWNYRVFAGGSFVFWTENRDQGIEYTQHLHGKKLAFFGDPQVWVKIRGAFSVGTRINVYYNLLGGDRQLQVYPTVGTKIQFR